MNGAGTRDGCAPGVARPVAPLRGLLWWEWRVNGGLITAFAALWLIGAVVLEVFVHPGYLLAFGLLYALIAGPVFGGGEAFAGVEEFTLALPATRSERYFARLALGGGVLVALQTAGLAAIALDLPQRLWGLVADSGFTEPYAPASPVSYWWAGALPSAVFAVGFAFAAGARSASPWQARSMSLMIAGAVLGLGCAMEQALWHEIDGWVSCPALFALAPLALLVGDRAYVRKEGISRAPGASGAVRWWMLWVVVMVVLALLALTVTRTGASSSKASSQRLEGATP